MKSKIISKFMKSSIHTLVNTLINTFIFILLVAAAHAYTDADLKYVSDNTITNQNFDTISSSYGDQGKDVMLTVSSNTPSELNNKYVGLVYADKELSNAVLISPDPAGKLFPIGYPNFQVESNSINTNLDLSTSDAVYPGIVYAVVSADNLISANDALIQISPTNSWLTGADGGPPCMPFGNQWVIAGHAFCSVVSSPYKCPCGEADADPLYDSYDVSTTTQAGNVKVKVTNAYWKNSDGYAIEITKDTNRIVVEARDKITGQVLDSAITSLYDTANGPDLDDTDDEVTLSAQTSENVSIFVNGIKTAEVAVEQVPQPTSPPGTGGSSGGGGGSGSSGSSSDSAGSNGNQEIVNNILTFTFDELSITEIKVYIKESADRAFLELKKSSKDSNKESNKEVKGIIYEHTSTSTDINKNNINLISARFKVSLNWLTENSLSREDVKLYYYDKEWKEAQTSIISEDIDYVYYLSTPAKISDFTIGDKTKTAREEAPAPVKEPPIIELEPVTETAKVQEKRMSFRDWSIAIITIMLILAIIGLIVLLIKNRKKE